MSDEEERENPELQWRDYVAIAIASLETVLLPFVILIVVILAVFLVIR